MFFGCSEKLKTKNRSSYNINEVTSTLSMLRKIYITSAHFLIYVAMIFFPVLIYLMPKYEMALTSLNLIALRILMSSCSYGYLELMISRNKEKKMAILSLGALFVNCLLVCILIFILHVGFSYVIIATMITYSLFTIAVLFNSGDIVGKRSWGAILSEWFPLRLALPYSSAFVISLLKYEELIYLPLLIALVLNRQIIGQIRAMTMKLIYNPDSVNL